MTSVARAAQAETKAKASASKEDVARDMHETVLDELKRKMDF
jgi:hypothetical protein